MQHPFSTFGGAAEFHTRIEKARYQKTDPTWSTLSGDAHDLLAQLLNADIGKVRPALSGGVHRVAVVCRTAVDVVCVTGGVCGCMCSCVRTQRMAMEDILHHPWFAALAPKVAPPSAKKRGRRLSGLMRHALMRGVVPPSAPPTPPPKAAVLRAQRGERGGAVNGNADGGGETEAA